MKPVWPALTRTLARARSGAVCSMLRIACSRGDFIAAGEGRLRMMSRNSAAVHAVCLPSRMPCTRQESEKTLGNWSSLELYIRLKYPSIADAMAWTWLMQSLRCRWCGRWPHRIEPVICADSGRYGGGVLRLGGHLLDDREASTWTK